MKLYGVLPSPFVQRVLLVARYKGRELALELPPGGLQSEAFGAISPMRRIPVLEDGDFRLVESGAIAAYLDETLPGRRLAPDDVRERARHASLISIVESEIAPALRQFMVQRVFRFGDDPALLGHAEAALARALAAVAELRDPGDGWALGARFGPADALLVPLIGLETVIEQHGGLASGLLGSGLDGYRARIAADPLAARTLAEMVEGFPRLVAGRRKVEGDAARG